MERLLNHQINSISDILDSIGDPFFIVDNDWRVVYINTAVVRRYGKQREQFLDKCVWDIFPEFIGSTIYHHLQKAFQEKKAVCFEEFSAKSCQWLEFNAYPSTTNCLVVHYRDITVRKQAELGLAKSKEQVVNILESISDAFFTLDENWNFTYLNKETEKYFGGRTREELIGKCIWEEFSSEVGSRFHTQLQQTVRDQRAVHFESSFINQELWFEISAYPSANGLSVYLRNNTERKQAEKLRSQVVAIFESSEDAIISFDLTGKIISWNKGATTIFGYSDTEVIGKFVSILAPPELKEESRRIIEQINRGEGINYLETIRQRKNGRNVDVSLRVSLLMDNEGKIVGASGIYRDITERKRFEEELNAERERLLVTLRSIADGVIATDKEGRVILMNEVAEKLTGFLHKESVGKDLDKVFYVINNKTSEPYRLVDTIKLSGETVHLNDAILVDKECRELAVEINCAPIKSLNDEYFGVVLVFQDVTEKQRTELELLKAEKLESLGILAGGIAHDFNNILAAILANLQLISLKIDRNENIKSYLQDTAETVKRASDLTKQLLTFSQGGAPIKKSTTITDLIKETAGFVLRGSKVNLEIYIPDNLWTVEVDQGQISQVINNLIINAQQAMPKGGTIKIFGENINLSPGGRYIPGKYIKISIKDTGVGIPKEHLTKIFDPFFTTKKEGTGLGLSMSYSIIKKHYGYLEVESAENAGTTFYIYLPASSKEVCNNEVQAEVAACGEGKILLMDDESMIRKVVGEMLSYFGYQVDLAKDGQEAIELYRQAKLKEELYDVVIMDLTIPGGMGGQEAISQLLKIDPQVKAIVSSGYANDPIMADYQKYGFSGVVSKPYKFEELQRVLLEVIDRRQLKLSFDE